MSPPTAGSLRLRLAGRGLLSAALVLLVDVAAVGGTPPRVLVASGTRAVDGTGLYGFQIVPGVSRDHVVFTALTQALIVCAGQYVSVAARTGERVPAPTDGTFNDFGTPLVSPRGFVLFTAGINASGVRDGLFRLGGAGPEIIGTNMSFPSLGPSNEAGDVVLSEGRSRRSVQLYRDATRSLIPVIESRDDLTVGTIALNERGWLALVAKRGRIGSVFRWTPEAGRQILAVDADRTPDGMLVLLDEVDRAPLALGADGRVAFIARILPDDPGSRPVDAVLVAGEGPRVVAKAGDTVEGHTIGGFFPYPMSFDSDGGLRFTAFFVDAGGIVSRIRALAGLLTLVAAEPAPERPGPCPDPSPSGTPVPALRAGVVERAGVYAYSGRRVRPVLREGDEIEGDPPITTVSDVMVNGTAVVAGVWLADDSAAIVLAEGRSIRRIVRSGDRSSVGDPVSPLVGWDPTPLFAVHRRKLLFVGTSGEDQYSIFVVRRRGSIESIFADAHVPVLPDGFGIVDSIVGNDQLVVFRAEDERGRAALVASVAGHLRTIVVPGDPASGFTGERFSGVTVPAVRGRRVAFAARLEGRERGLDGVWVWAHGTLRRLPGPREGERESYTGDFALTETGVVALTADERNRIVHWDAEDRRRVIAREGDPIRGGGSIRWLGSVGAEGDRVVFVANLSDQAPAREAILTVGTLLKTGQAVGTGSGARAAPERRL